MLRRSNTSVRVSKSKPRKAAARARLANLEALMALAERDLANRSLSLRPSHDRTRPIPQWQYVPSIAMPDSMGGSYTHASGSHYIENATFNRCQELTVGNTAGDGKDDNISDDSTSTKGHTYNGLSVFDSGCVHIGNTGKGNEGHKYIGLHVETTKGAYFGDFQRSL